MEQTREYTRENKSGLSKTIQDVFIMAKRDLLKIKHNPDKLLDVTLVPVIFMVMFGYVFGGAIAGNVKDYLPTLVPGILIQTLLSASSATGTQLREDLNTGVFDRFKALPIARIVPLVGLLVADIVKSAVAVSVSLITGYLMGWRPEAGFLWVLAVALLGIFISWCLSWIFATIGLLIENASTIQGVSMVLMMMLTFFSGAFVPTGTLPTVLRYFAEWNPVTKVIDACREMLTYGTVGVDALWTIIAGVVIVAIFAPITLKLYNRKV